MSVSVRIAIRLLLGLTPLELEQVLQYPLTTEVSKQIFLCGPLDLEIWNFVKL